MECIENYATIIDYENPRHCPFVLPRYYLGTYCSEKLIYVDFTDSRGTAKDPTCYRGDQSMVTLSSALVMKMLMLLPTLLKVIAAKAIFGLVMGVVSVILSKMAILPLLLSYANKSVTHANSNTVATTGSYRQGEF